MAPQPRHAAADAGRRRPPRPLRIQHVGHDDPDRQSSALGVANAFASFLLDWPNTVQRDLKVIDQPGTQHMGTFLFVHDKWQARSNVTVDLGLRWEYYTPLQGLEGKGTLANYDPSTNTIRVAGYGDTDNALNVKKHFTNFAPRTGVSWRLNEKSVVRAGYGASTIPFPDNRYAFNYPVKQNYNGSAANGFQRAGSMAAGFPDPVLLNIPSDGIIPATGSLLNSTYRRDPVGPARGHTPFVERRVPARAAVPLHGRRRVRRQPWREPRHGRRHECRHGLRSGQRRAPAIRDVQPHRHVPHTTNDNKSQYNALQMKIDRRFSNGLLVTNSYTLSKSMDYANENGSINTPIDFSTSWARSNFDRTHNYVSTVIYELPWGPRKKWLNEGMLAQHHRRMAAQQHLRRAVGRAALASQQAARCSTPRATRRMQTRSGRRTSSAVSDPACSTSIRRRTRSRQTQRRET